MHESSHIKWSKYHIYVLLANTRSKQIRNRADTSYRVRTESRNFVVFLSQLRLIFHYEEYHWLALEKAPPILGATENRGSVENRVLFGQFISFPSAIILYLFQYNSNSQVSVVQWIARWTSDPMVECSNHSGGRET